MRKIITLMLGMFFLGTTVSVAQYTVLHTFYGPPDGNGPAGSPILVGNKLYGVTSLGGTNGDGNIFSIDTTGTGYKDLLDFKNTNGNGPNGTLIFSGGKFYGVTISGGKYGYGVLYSVDSNGTGFANLHDFDSTIGTNPGSLFLSGNVLYGEAGGGANGYGCIFSIKTNGSGYKDIHDFSNTGVGINGEYPCGRFTQSGKLLYGLTSQGGTKNYGIIYSIDTNGTGFKKLHDFNYTIGGSPVGGLLLSGGTLFGATTHSITGPGIIYSMDTNGTRYKSLLAFNDTNGSMPSGLLIITGNILYGTTTQGGVNNLGCLFTIDTNGKGYQNLYNFSNTYGSTPSGPPMLSGNTLYGLTYDGGSGGLGVVYKFGSVLTTINKVISENGNLKVYPNPNNGVFQLEINNYELGIKNTVEVYNMLGAKIYSGFVISNSQLVIDIGNQPAGIYFYRAYSESGQLLGYGKFVKK